MRFTEGIWLDRSGLKLHRAQEMWRCQVEKDSIQALVPCHEIRIMNDTTYGPVLRFSFTAPRKDMISVKVSHFKGLEHKGPDFELCTEDAGATTTDGEAEMTLRSGKLELRIQKKGLFGFAFYYDGKPLTSAGEKGTAYVTDIDYEADQLADYNHREKRPYQAATWLRELLSLAPGEYIYGMGERFTQLVRNGQSLDVWNRDGGSGCDQAYKSIPFYLSSKGYGVLVNTPGLVDFEVATANTRSVEFSVEGEELEYIVIGAEAPKAVLGKYTALTGRSPVPPPWSFGLWLSTSWEPDSSKEITMEFINGMAERDIPLSVFHFDARWMDDWNCCDFVWANRFGNAAAMLQAIHDKGVKSCVWINPYVSQEGRLFAEGKAGGYFLKKPNGDIWQTDGWMSGMAVVDFTNPEAADWYARRLGEIVDMGVDCIKTDFGERIPTEVVYHDGSDPVRMHNYYPYLYNKCIYEMLQKKKGRHQAVVFSRSSTVGTQQFPVNWGGDNESTYISMAESLRGGLSFCQSGFGFWAQDISGFGGKATPDLYKRWVAFGMLNTHSRLHGRSSYRVPWEFDEESSAVLRRFTRLKCSLMPYIYAGAVKVNEEGTPLMQAMVLAYPEDRSCHTLEMQYMLGDDLLVAPIFREDGQVEFYLPATGGGLWTNYLDGETFEGGRWHTRGYDYFGLPLLARPGALIPVGGRDDTVEYPYEEKVTLRLFQPAEGRPSRCRVRRMDRTLAFEATATLEGNRLTVEAPSAGEWALEWVGQGTAAAVEGGEYELTGGGLFVRAHSSKIIITF